MKQIMGETWDLAAASFQPCGVYKTHDLPYELAEHGSLKVVFLYGRPSDSIISVMGRYKTHGMDWVDRHFAHMHATGSYDELLHRDVLRIGEQIEAWSKARNANILGIRYETLWENVGVLNEFLGYKIQLPEKKTRQSVNADVDTVRLARRTYASLDQKVANLPDYFHFSRQPKLRAVRAGTELYSGEHLG